jgi:hypothetical protein
MNQVVDSNLERTYHLRQMEQLKLPSGRFNWDYVEFNGIRLNYNIDSNDNFSAKYTYNLSLGSYSFGDQLIDVLRSPVDWILKRMIKELPLDFVILCYPLTDFSFPFPLSPEDFEQLIKNPNKAVKIDLTLTEMLKKEGGEFDYNKGIIKATDISLEAIGITYIPNPAAACCFQI